MGKIQRPPPKRLVVVVVYFSEALDCFDKLQSSQPGEGGNGVPVQLARSALSEVIAAAEAAGAEWALDQSSAGSVMDTVIANLETHADDTIPPCVSIDTLLWQFVPHAFPDLLPMDEA